MTQDTHVAFRSMLYRINKYHYLHKRKRKTK